MNAMMSMQIIICIIIIFIVTANPATSGSGLDGLMGGGSDKKSKSGRFRKKERNFLFLLFLFFSMSLGFSIVSQKTTPNQIEYNYVEKLIDGESKND